MESVNIPNLKADRLSGKNRFETAQLIAKKAYKNPKGAILVNNEMHSDALIASLLSSNQGLPLLLVNTASIDESTKKYLEENGINNITLVGGEKTISESIKNEIEKPAARDTSSRPSSSSSSSSSSTSSTGVATD